MELRTEYKRIRRDINGKAEKSEMIRQKLKNTPEYRTAGVIAFYASLPDEVNTSGMIQAAFADGKTVCLPKIKGGEMQFYTVTLQTKFTAGAFGILEPVKGDLISHAQIDLIIVPLLAADAQNYRLGFGGGYYDSYLKQFQGDTVGICFKEQLSPVPLPHEAHDIPLKKILNE
ncbi:MAG: 5-formyltetrahydrofolate cyclo-ligase [Clostridia bacterium]|nr:5-formyltetrahydrofolate cyclo-ligase [Clostridia bacterium]